MAWAYKGDSSIVGLELKTNKKKGVLKTYHAVDNLRNDVWKLQLFNWLAVGFALFIIIGGYHVMFIKMRRIKEEITKLE